MAKEQNNNKKTTFSQITIQPPIPHKGRMPRGKADAKPRGRMTAYAFFVQTCREEHKKKHPEENVVFAEFSKKCAERWKVRNFYQKQIFKNLHKQFRKLYQFLFFINVKMQFNIEKLQTFPQLLQFQEMQIFFKRKLNFYNSGVLFF